MKIMENNFRNNGGYNKFSNQQPQQAVNKPVVENVEAQEGGFIKKTATKCMNSVKNLPTPVKVGGGIVIGGLAIYVIDKYLLGGRIKKSVLGVFGLGKKDKEDDTEEEIM